MPLPCPVRPTAQGCGLAATMGLRDQETRVYARARTEQLRQPVDRNCTRQGLHRRVARRKQPDSLRERLFDSMARADSDLTFWPRFGSPKRTGCGPRSGLATEDVPASGPAFTGALGDPSPVPAKESPKPAHAAVTHRSPIQLGGYQVPSG